MQIQIVTTTVTTKPTARGSYQELEVVYKNITFQGKVESKKIMSFGAGATAFKTLSESSQGSTWDVVVVKNDKGYNDWTAVTPSTGAPAAVEQSAAARSNPTPKSNYETSEERAQRQILIVRQSSLSSSVALLTAGAKSPPKLAEVLDVAKAFEAYVFGIKDPGPSGFDDLPDFPESEIA